MFQTSATAIEGVMLVQSLTRVDARGDFTKLFQRSVFDRLGLSDPIAEQYVSRSRRDVIRGMHFQVPPMDHEKLVFCTEGRALDVVLDLRKSSESFGRSVAVELDAGGLNGVLVPKGCAHGFLAQSESATLAYFVTTEHAPEQDKGVRWDSFGYAWPVETPVVSERDAALPPLADFESPFS